MSDRKAAAKAKKERKRKAHKKARSSPGFNHPVMTRMARQRREQADMTATTRQFMSS